MTILAEPWTEWPGEVLTKRTSNRNTGPRMFHVFTDCPSAERYRMRRKDRSVMFHDARMCEECRSKILAGEVPDVR